MCYQFVVCTNSNIDKMELNGCSEIVEIDYKVLSHARMKSYHDFMYE